MAPICRFWLGILIVLPLITGCDNRKIDALKAELTQSKAEMSALEGEHQRLLSRCGRLQDELTELQSKQENLEIQSTQLAEWAQQVATQFGPSVWYIGPDEKPLPYKQLKNASTTELARELNRLFDRDRLPHFILGKVEGDTAYVRITGDRQLTQEMGTTGAIAYIQAITYTLTSLPGIQYVDLDFEEGDHAMPGKYSR